MNDPKGNPIVFVEYRDGHPFDVKTEADSYDFEFCKRDKFSYYQNSGGGVDSFELSAFHDVKEGEVIAEFWCDPQLLVTPATEAEQAKLGYRRLSKPLENPFDFASEEDSHYCTICDDYLPGEDSCDHVFWNDAEGGWHGPGVDDHSSSKDPYGGFKKHCLTFVKTIGCARSLRKALAKGRQGIQVTTYDGMITVSYDMRIGKRCFNEPLSRSRSKWGSLRDGANWVRSLGPKTPEANEITIKWLDELIAEQNERRISRAKVYVVGSDPEKLSYQRAQEKNQANGNRDVIRYIRPSKDKHV